MKNAKYLPAALNLLISVLEIQRLTVTNNPAEIRKGPDLGRILAAIRTSIDLARELPPAPSELFPHPLAESVESIPLTLEGMEIQARYANPDYSDRRINRLAEDARRLIKALSDLIRQTGTLKDGGRRAETDITEESLLALHFPALITKDEFFQLKARFSVSMPVNLLLSTLTLSKEELIASFKEAAQNEGGNELEKYIETLLEYSDSIDRSAGMLHELSEIARARILAAAASIR
jgi:hypothetical protein